MNKIRKYIIGMLAVVLAMVMLFPADVFAAEEADPSHMGKLTISYQDEKVSLEGAGFAVYQVAAADKNGEWIPTESFATYHVNIPGKESDDWMNIASTLEGYILRDAVVPYKSGKTDANGILILEHLPDGLYLVLGERHIQNGMVYECDPFMMVLPMEEQNGSVGIYDVTVYPKHESRPDESGRTLTRKVLKVWKDEGYQEKRPKEVIVQLLQNGKVYDTVTLNAENNWRHTWTNLDEGCRWTVVEKEPENYIVEVTQEGITFVVTNRYKANTPPGGGGSTPPANPPSKKPDTKLPQTGQLWWPVPVLFSLGLLLVILGLILRRSETDEK